MMEALTSVPPFNWALSLQVAILYIACLFGFLLYVFFSTRALNRHSYQLKQEYQTAFLLKQFQKMLLVILLIFCLVAGATIGLISLHSHTNTNRKEDLPSPPLKEELAQPTPLQPVIPNTSPDTNNAQILDLFDAPQNDQADSHLVTLKRHFERALNAAYILQRCMSNSEDYVTPVKELLKRQLLTHHPHLQTEGYPAADVAQLYAGILTAAEGSYTLFYQHTPCDSPELELLEQQLRQFSSALSSPTQ